MVCEKRLQLLESCETGMKLAAWNTVFDKLETFGLLLESDPKLPGVCRLITGEPMKGSWWSHPMAQTIFQVNERLDDHPDVIITKLISNKVTFVHRRLWPDLLAIGSAREAWQTRKLSTQAKALLKIVDTEGAISSDKLVKLERPGDAARELEFRLLVHSEQFHTESGKHAKRLETWEHWAERSGANPSIKVAEAKKKLEAIVLKLNEEFHGKGSLPWQTKGRSMVAQKVTSTSKRST